MTVNSELKALVDSWQAANQARDVDAILGHYTDDLLAFDAIAQLQFKGRQAYYTHWKACLEMCPGPMTFELHQLQQWGEGSVGFGHFLCHCGGTDLEGNSHSCWMRVTQGYRKIDGQWRIVHDHFSAPFDPESGQALFGLEP
jgi:uncharacterized protein (TIGR02246 family)